MTERVKIKMNNTISEDDFFRTESIRKIILKLAPPIMLAQLIQALYNIVDSYFVGKFSDDALTALSVIYPIQFVIIALGVGTGIGVNTYMASLYALKKKDEADKTAGTGIMLAAAMWLVFSVLCIFFLKFYISVSAKSEAAVSYANTYGLIVCIGSLGIFLESIFTKIHQARGNMKTPMLAQIFSAAVNIVLDPILIFGPGPFPAMGISGAAVATVIGQFTAAAVTGFTAYIKFPKLKESVEYIKPIFGYGYPQILMQMLMTLYIVVLNIILAGFNDAAVTALGLYYKLQTFFFIPLLALQTCIVPVLSFNYTVKDYKRCHRLVMETLFISSALMLVGVLAFEIIPDKLIMLFTHDKQTIEIGSRAFRIIALSFIPIVFSLVFPVFFQAIGKSVQSVFLAVMRQIICLIPIFWLLSKISLDVTWFAFPIAEIVTGGCGGIMYIITYRRWKKEMKSNS